MGQSVFLNFGRDVQGQNAYAPQFAWDTYSTTLTNGNVTNITVPTNYAQWIVNFTFQQGTDVWVAWTPAGMAPNQAQAPVSNDDFIFTFSNLNPASRTVFAGDTLSFITVNATADVGICFYVVR